MEFKLFKRCSQKCRRKEKFYSVLNQNVFMLLCVGKIQALASSDAYRVIPPSRYNRPWRPLDWRNSIEVSSRLAHNKAYRVGTACWGCPPGRTREAPLPQSHHFLKGIFDVAHRFNDQAQFIIVLYKAIFFAYAHDFIE